MVRKTAKDFSVNPTAKGFSVNPTPTCCGPADEESRSGGPGAGLARGPPSTRWEVAALLRLPRLVLDSNPTGIALR
jgi:hypothetical protein